jgi:hypothetical protein
VKPLGIALLALVVLVGCAPDQQASAKNLAKQACTGTAAASEPATATAYDSAIAAWQQKVGYAAKAAVEDSTWDPLLTATEQEVSLFQQGQQMLANRLDPIVLADQARSVGVALNAQCAKANA